MPGRHPRTPSETTDADFLRQRIGAGDSKMRGLDDYLSLEEQTNSGMSWSYIQAEIDNHVGKLARLRAVYLTPLTGSALSTSCLRT
jgi:hypothetical protein